jgi:hypothetical protein
LPARRHSTEREREFDESEAELEELLDKPVKPRGIAIKSRKRVTRRR